MNRPLVLKGITVLAVGALVITARIMGAFGASPIAYEQNSTTNNNTGANASNPINSQQTTTPPPVPVPTPPPVPPPAPTSPVVRPTPTPTPPPAAPIIRFRDGTYTSTGNYITPGGGHQSIKVTLTISSDIVVDSTVVGLATSEPSETYQGDFIAKYKASVMGKRIDQLSLGKIASSSLTPGGFNNAVDNIEAMARK